MDAPMPSTVKVGPHVYTILRQSAAQLGDMLGDCDTNTLQIRIRKRLRRTKAQETLTHEILHACLHPTIIRREHVGEEEFVEAAAPVLFQVLRENPVLVAYLAG